ncbi:deoxynucleoside triphosphate triphosphohydrolase SAMHD1-like isoform X4 [Haliotis rubra]|uniref:deoxynucleoside triphosphate triphosphohydrolase SAMHD1-like isoform X4 n=1 Tax=Haliotis rubra TaxID=36100 RepID=UPI001EE62858|nr:deoxynucleoside triphosphate triphosphohydrolase SAMHD1-like isoform X4 [Haliotis rubra]
MLIFSITDITIMSTPKFKTEDKRKADFEDGSDASCTTQFHSGNPGVSESDSDSDLSKIFNDPIHGTIRVSGLCMKIIDTPQFQRLRYLKQLGGGYFVYPGATHNRFEHSIGTYHLAGKFARILKWKHPAHFGDDEIKCIEMAGLCHDLGHGPFSHVSDNMFIPRVKPDSKWKNHVTTESVIEMRSTKPYLYEIVANSKTGIDVDKWDYFARDCHMVGMKNNFDHDRYMEMARINDVDGKPRICTRDKNASNLYDMFRTRETLHRRVYQHPVTRGVELMIVDALVKLDKTALIPGKMPVK